VWLARKRLATSSCTVTDWHLQQFMYYVLDNDNYERSSDYAVDVLYILGFISMGDGCTEEARLLGPFGLPNNTTMESRSFTIIEERIGLSWVAR
jgi:hypothetical protein